MACQSDHSYIILGNFQAHFCGGHRIATLFWQSQWQIQNSLLPTKKGLKKEHCKAVFNYLTNIAKGQKPTARIHGADGWKIKNLPWFEFGSDVFGLPEEFCISYNTCIVLPTDDNVDCHWLQTIVIEWLNGYLPSMVHEGLEVDGQVENKCVEHFVKALIPAIYQKYVVGKDRLNKIEFFHCVVEAKLNCDCRMGV